MNIINKKVKDLIPYINNPRNNKNAIDKVAASIKEFGFKVPIIIDADGVVITGHTRLLASKKLNIDEVPCIIADDLTPAQIKAFRIADNKVSEFSEWDMELLGIEMEGLKELDFDISLTGFELNDIEEFMPIEEKEYNEEEDVIEEPPINPYSKRGDIWLLGRHRLMCGSSTEEEDVKILMNGNKADMCFTDPPYLMGFTGNVNNDGSKSHNSIHGEIKNDKMSKEEGQQFIDKIIENIKVNVIGAYYICFYRLGMHYVFNSLQKSNLDYKALIVWHKPGGTLSNSDYKSMYEPIFYGWVDKHEFYDGHNGWDLWTINKTKKNDLHPTMKPIELVEKAIGNSSKKNEIVLDFFGGSGSTLIASDITNRINYSMELDEKYVDVIVKRYINHKQNNGEDVTLLRNGQEYKFEDIKEEFENDKL